MGLGYAARAHPAQPRIGQGSSPEIDCTTVRAGGEWGRHGPGRPTLAGTQMAQAPAPPPAPVAEQARLNAGATDPDDRARPGYGSLWRIGPQDK